MEMMIMIVLIGGNLFGTYFFAGGYYPIVGVGLCCCSAVSCIFLSEKPIMHYFIRKVIKSHDIDKYFEKGNANMILVSIAYLACAIKIGIGIAVFVEAGAALLVALSILIAFGYFFEGRSSGMSISGAWGIAKLVTKIYLFLTSWVSKIFEWVIKAEYAILKIKISDNWKSE